MHPIDNIILLGGRATLIIIIINNPFYGTLVKNSNNIACSPEDSASYTDHILMKVRMDRWGDTYRHIQVGQAGLRTNGLPSKRRTDGR